MTRITRPRLLAALLVAMVCAAYAFARNPCDEATATVAMDLNDAITTAQTAARGHR